METAQRKGREFTLRVVNFIARLLGGSVFLVSAIDKVFHPLWFSSVLSNYPFVSNSLVFVLTFVVTMVELFLGMALWLGIWFRKVSMAALGLIVIYILFLLYSMATGNTHHSCGCFLTQNSGPSVWTSLFGGSTITLADVIRDGVIIVILVIGLVTYHQRLGLDTWYRRASRSSDMASWNDNRLRLYFFSGWISVILVSLLGGVSPLVTLVRENRSPLANVLDYRPTGKTIKTHTIAPEFQLSTARGQMYSVQEFKGKVVLLEFFALWCPHCQAEAPIIHQIVSQMPKSDFQALSVIASPYSRYYDSSGGTNLNPYTRQDVAWFQHKYKVINPILVDPKFVVTNRYLGQWYPTIYILNKQGRVAAVYSGNTPRTTLTKEIQSVE